MIGRNQELSCRFSLLKIESCLNVLNSVDEFTQRGSCPEANMGTSSSSSYSSREHSIVIRFCFQISDFGGDSKRARTLLRLYAVRAKFSSKWNSGEESFMFVARILKPNMVLLTPAMF